MFIQIVRKFEGEKESIHEIKHRTKVKKKHTQPLTVVWLTNYSCNKFAF